MSDMWVVGYSLEKHGWVIWCPVTHTVIAGPYDTPKEAEEAIETRARRLADGWEP